MSSVKRQNAATPAPSWNPRENAKSDATIQAEGDDGNDSDMVTLDAPPVLVDAKSAVKLEKEDKKETEEGKEATVKATDSKGTGLFKTQTSSARGLNMSTEQIDAEDAELEVLAIARELAAQETEAAKQQTLRAELELEEALDRLANKLGGDSAKPMLRKLIGQLHKLSETYLKLAEQKAARLELEMKVQALEEQLRVLSGENKEAMQGGGKN
ncbi:hypothetical protein FS749_014010 [Ceratobasidium sp. UAMH 11750]|nr:hypothetical protein FS749_014010 [Ceratobasidium sp. UAMH 11750]